MAIAVLLRRRRMLIRGVCEILLFHFYDSIINSNASCQLGNNFSVQLNVPISNFPSKFNYFLLFKFIGLWICNYLKPKTPVDEIIISEKLKKKLKNGLSSKADFRYIDPEMASNSIVNRLNGQITIGEYFSDDYFQVPKLKKILSECIVQSAKEK